MLAVNGMPDHVHIFFGMRPSQSLSDLMQDVKASSSKWINENKLVPGKFEWQEGYGAFSYGKSQVSNVIDYVLNQEYHHQRLDFFAEYKEFLDELDVDYDEQYIFKPLL
jgi:putative transposase